MLYSVSPEQQARESILLSKREAARSLSISVHTLDKLIAEEKVPVRRIGRRVLIARQYLEQFALRKDVHANARP
jgi:excisionase family DNA binding protein